MSSEYYTCRICKNTVSSLADRCPKCGDPNSNHINSPISRLAVGIVAVSIAMTFVGMLITWVIL